MAKLQLKLFQDSNRLLRYYDNANDKSSKFQIEKSNVIFSLGNI